MELLYKANYGLKWYVNKKYCLQNDMSIKNIVFKMTISKTICTKNSSKTMDK